MIFAMTLPFVGEVGPLEMLLCVFPVLLGAILGVVMWRRGRTPPEPPASAGWRPDPTGRHELRYFDGIAWTGRVSDGGVESDEGIA